MKVDRLKEFLNYNSETGEVTYKKTNKSVYPDEDGLVIITDPSTKQKKKFKMQRLCYSLAYNVDLAKESKIIHKNLDETDFSIVNLLMVSQEQFKEIKEAWRNLQGGIRLTVHPKDMYSYKLFWYEKGIERSQVIHDVVVAKKVEKKLLLRFSKILTKYCTSVD